MDSVMPYVLALVPTIGVGTLFYFVMKSVLEGDRRERLAQARWEAEHAGRDASGSPTSTDPPVAAPGAATTTDAVSPQSPSGER